jgi:hypothetical protein
MPYSFELAGITESLEYGCPRYLGPDEDSLNSQGSLIPWNVPWNFDEVTGGVFELAGDH